MNLLTSVLLTNLVTLAFSDAYYPPNFYLKGPTSQATIYGVDGSKILSVADAGSISSDGVKGPTVSSYSSSQNLTASSGPGIVLQGPSMSATIIGPSGSVATDGNAGGGQGSNYNGQYGSESIGTPTYGSAGDNIAQPSLPSVNIKGPSAWGMNVGPTFASHTNANKQGPCSFTSKGCGVNSFGATHSNGNQKSGEAGDDSTLLPSAPSVNIQGPSAWGKNVGPTFTSHGHFGGSNNLNQQPSQPTAEPCTSTSKGCGVNSFGTTYFSGTQKSGKEDDNTVSPSAPSVNIQGPSAWGTNIGPTFTNHAQFGGSNKENQQPSQATAEPCNSKSKGCGATSIGDTHSNGSQKSGEVGDNTVLPSAPSVNIQGPSTWGKTIDPSFTSHGIFGGSNHGYQQPSQNKAEPCNSTSKSCGVNSFGVNHSSGTQNSGDRGYNTILPSAPNVNIQGPSTRGTNIGPSFASHGNFGGSNKANQQSSQTKTEPCNSTTKGCDINSYGATHSSGTQISNDTGDSTALPSAPSVNIKGPSAWGANVGPTYTSQIDFDRNNAENQQHTASVAGECGSNSKNCEVNSFDATHISEKRNFGSAGESSGSPSVPTINIQGPTAWGKNVGATYTSDSNLDGSTKGNQESAENGTKSCDSSSGSCGVNSADVTHSSGTPTIGGASINTAKPSVSSVNIQGPNAWGANVGPSYTSDNLNRDKEGNQQSRGTAIAHNTETGENIQGSSILSSTTDFGRNLFGNNQGNKKSTTAATDSGLQNEESLNVHSFPSASYGPSQNNQNKKYHSGSFFNLPGIYTHTQNAGNVNAHKGALIGQKLLSNTRWKGHNSFTSSSIQGSHNLGHNRGTAGYFPSSSYISPVYNKPSHAASSSWFATKTVNGAKDNVVKPESNIGFDRQNNGYGALKYQGHNSESSSLAPPTYVMPDGVNQAQQTLFGSDRDGKSAKNSKYDCYVIELPADPYAYDLSPGEYSVLLKKIAHHHYHKHLH